MGKKKPKQEVVKYAMSIHFGICSGPVDYLWSIFFEEKSAWPQLAPRPWRDQGSYLIKNHELFGGYKKEGGVQGTITWLPGYPDQVMPEVLAAKHGRTSATMPAYRGIASIFFTGRPGDDMKSFYWRANSPYLPGVWCEVGRASVALGETHARIYRAGIDPASGNPGSQNYTKFSHHLDCPDLSFAECTGSMDAHYRAVPSAFTPPANCAALRCLNPTATRYPTFEEAAAAVPGEAVGSYVLYFPRASISSGPVTQIWLRTEAGTPVAVSAKFDSNPAHIIYDCLTNTNWGMGAPASAIDVGSFTGAAAVLYGENFGLSMIWTLSSAIEDFISEVLDHIEATLFVNPRTGLLTLKLIRNDYSIPALPVFTPDNSLVTNFSRKLWGETINEIVVTWTNDMEEEESVVAQDLANIEAQGGVISDGRNYYGVRNASLATRLAHRDLRSASTPLAKCDMEVNREAWALLPGDCCVLDSPEDGIDSIVMRVGPVDYGKPGDSAVRVSLMEDVFSLALADYSEPPESQWVDTSEPPSPADYAEIITLPYYVVANGIDAATVAGVDYPEVFAGILVAEDGQDTDTFQLYGEATDAAGGTAYEDFGTRRIASRATLPDALPLEIETTILTFPDRTQGNGPVVGGLMILQGADETVSEICLVSDFGISGYTFKRGVLDTIPRAWPVGTPVWFVDESMNFIDDVDIRADGETVNYKILTNTSQGTLDEALAPVVSETMTARPHLPLRPADVKVNGDNGFTGPVDMAGLDPIPVTWARRNRETETAIIKAWDDGDVTPEAGQTTVIEVLDPTGTSVVTTHAGLTGTSFNVPAASFAGAASGWIRVGSERDGHRELQAYAILCVLPVSISTTVTGLSASVSVGAVTVSAASAGTVVLLCGFEGTDGSTAFVDESPTARTLTAAGNAQIDTAQFKFGASSALFDGTGDYISAPDSTDWDLSNANADQFTIEAWVRLSNITNRMIVAQSSGFPQASFRLLVLSSGELRFSFSVTGSTWIDVTTSGAAIATGAWYHLAVDKDATGKIRIYKDGVMMGSTTPADSSFFNSTAILSIGADGLGATSMAGWIDELRITKGFARYASDSGYTVPTAAFPRA